MWSISGKILKGETRSTRSIICPSLLLFSLPQINPTALGLSAVYYGYFILTCEETIHFVGLHNSFILNFSSIIPTYHTVAIFVIVDDKTVCQIYCV